MDKVTPRKTVNIALIGSGFMGKEHSKAYSLAPVSCPDIMATPVKKILCDAIGDKVAERARLWGYEEWCTDYHEILERDDIDIIDICTTAFTHADIAIDCVKAGKFVICEKPLVTTMEDADRLMAAVKECHAEGRTATGFNKRRWPAVLYAKQLIEEGVIGKVLVYNGRYCQDVVSRRKTAWPGSSWKRSGGMADCTSHIADMCRFILDDAYDSVVGLTYPMVPTLPIRLPEPGEDPATIPTYTTDSEDLAVIIAKMKSGVTATLYQTWAYCGAGEGISFEVHGTKGSVRWTGENPSVLQLAVDYGTGNTGFKNIIMSGSPVDGHPYRNNVPGHRGFGVGVADNMAFQAYEVIQAYCSGKPYNPSFVDAYEILKVCDATRESTRTGQWVKI